jgi:hypothetical protein
MKFLGPSLSCRGKGDCVEYGLYIIIVNLEDNGYVEYADSSKPA